MVERELDPYRREGGPKIMIKGSDVLLPPQCTSILAMTLHELATNAVKYGALSSNTGQLAISWKTARGGRLPLTWEERATLAQMPARRNSGFGMQLIDKGIRHNLGGDTKVEFRPTGLYVELNVPLEPSKEPRLSRKRRRRFRPDAASISCGSGRDARPRRGDATARLRRCAFRRPRPATGSMRAARLVRLADEIGQRRRHMLAGRIVGRARLAELEPELGGRIVEGLDRAERHHQPLRHVGEGELHLEAFVRHLQVPELVLQHDGHLFRILLFEALRHRHALGARIEGDVEVMLAGQPVALHARQNLAHHAAQSVLREKIVSDFVFCHGIRRLPSCDVRQSITPS